MDPKTPEIVRFEDRYFEALAALYCRVWANAEAYGESFTVDEVRRTIEKLTDLWILRSDGQVVGFVGGMPLLRYENTPVLNLIRDPAAGYYIDELGVEPRLQDQGFGGKLLQHIVEQAGSRGYRVSVLKTAMVDRNRAPSLYARHGFQVLRETRGTAVTRRVIQPRVDGRPEIGERIYFVRAAPSDIAGDGQLADPRFAAAVANGLLSPGSKSLPCEYFYDEEGAKIFSQICDLVEYYPTRAEEEIIERRMENLLQLCGNSVVLVELGPGDGRKTRRFLRSLQGRCSSVSYIPIDIAQEPLGRLVADLARDYPEVQFQPIAEQYLPGLATLPKPDGARMVVLWLGTAIGNLEPQETEAVLGTCARVIGTDGAVVVGADLKKDPLVLERAYSDSLGVTARFNLNLLQRINRELRADFDLSGFEHRAFYNPAESRVEMHLVSRRRQRAWIHGLRLAAEFGEGESIHTENSYKFSRADIERVADATGLSLQDHYLDSEAAFSVNVLVPRRTAPA